MKRVAMSIVALACMCCFAVSTVNAGGECCKGKDAAAKTASAKDGKAGCCGGAKMAGCCDKDGFPTMAMMVGDKSIACPVEAEKVAKESKSKVIYVVAGEKYECKDKATAALADEAEVFADHFITVACVVNGNPIYCDSASKCSGKSEAAGCCKAGEKAKTGTSETTKVAAKSDEKSGCCMEKAGATVKYMVLGKTFDKKADAEKARDEVMVAVKKVSMKVMCDGKEVSCDKVCPEAEKAGKVNYMVNGEKVNCKYQARIMTAKAKYEAAKGATEKKMAKA